MTGDVHQEPHSESQDEAWWREYDQHGEIVEDRRLRHTAHALVFDGEGALLWLWSNGKTTKTGEQGRTIWEYKPEFDRALRPRDAPAALDDDNNVWRMVFLPVDDAEDEPRAAVVALAR